MVVTSLSWTDGLMRQWSNRKLVQFELENATEVRALFIMFDEEPPPEWTVTVSAGTFVRADMTAGGMINVRTTRKPGDGDVLPRIWKIVSPHELCKAEVQAPSSWLKVITESSDGDWNRFHEGRTVNTNRDAGYVFEETDLKNFQVITAQVDSEHVSNEPVEPLGEAWDSRRVAALRQIGLPPTTVDDEGAEKCPDIHTLSERDTVLVRRKNKWIYGKVTGFEEGGTVVVIAVAPERTASGKTIQETKEIPAKKVKGLIRLLPPIHVLTSSSVTALATYRKAE